MAINLYIRLLTTSGDLDNNAQHYKEIYNFKTTGSDANEHLQDYRLRHFLVANCPNSTVTKNSGLMVYDGTGKVALTGSYNDWTTPNRPPRFNNDSNQFNTELIMRFYDNPTFSQLAPDPQAWITVPYSNDNGVFSRDDLEHSFSFLGYSNGEYVKNPMNVVLEHRSNWGYVSRIYTDPSTLPSNGNSNCEDNSNLYKVETVVVHTQNNHGLKVGDAVTLYSRSVSHVPSYTGNSGRMFGMAAGERYLGDFVVTAVPNETTFKYETYHNPMKINASNHPEYTHDTWNDLVWEHWDLYEYNEGASASVSGSSVVFTFTDSNPSGYTCKHNFVEGDLVTFLYNTSDQVQMKVTAVGNNTITAVPVDGVTFPSGSGTLVYTPRLPSSDVAFNVAHSDIAPQKAKSHANENAIFYACQDTYYYKNEGYVSHGTEKNLNLVKDTVYPVIKFPVPIYNGEATSDPNLVSKLYIYCNNYGGIANNTVLLYGFGSDAWVENDNNVTLNSKNNGEWTGGTPINTNTYSNATRTTNNRYVTFDIANGYTVDMLIGNVPKSVFINSAMSGQVNYPIQFASREDDDGHWPYLAISSVKFIARKPTIELDNTYMYLICDSIEKGTYGGGTAFIATVSPKMSDSSSLLNVRSWDADKPFFEIGDKIEVMNTEHYDTVSAEVVGVTYGQECKVYFRYDNPPDIGTGVKECGIIRNRSRMISTYTTTDAENVPNNLNVDGPEVYGKYGYETETIEFDVIHDEAKDGSTSLSAVYGNGDVESNEETPVILTDVEIVAGNEHDRPADRFMHVGPNYGVVLKGFNMNKLSANAYAVLGHPRWEDGLMSGGRSVALLPVDGHPEQRKFYYDDAFNLQRAMPIYGIRNVEGVTEFKVHEDDFPFCGPGDVVGAVYTGIYIGENHAVPPSNLKYGKNYYVVNATTEGHFVWLSLSSAYIFRYEALTPEYVSLSDDEVAYINSKIPSGTLTEDKVPLVLYSTVTSVTIKDTDFDTTNYANRLYLQIDEEAPIYYIPEASDEHLAGRAFDIYLSDLNDIYTINGQLLENFTLGSIEYILGGHDSRFIKLTLTLDSSTTLEIIDAAGNYTSIDLEIISIDSDIKLSLTGIASVGTTHTLSFKVTDSDYNLLSTAIARNAGDTGIYASFGTIQNISAISHEEERGSFTFDLVIMENILGQTNGILEVWAGDTAEGTSHKNDKWAEPIIFQKEQTCVETWDVLQYRGVNLYDMLEFRGPNASAFEIDDNDHNATSIPIKVVSNQTGVKSFGIKWKGVNPSLALSKYLNTVTVTTGPTIDIQPESNKSMKLRKGEEWEEPSPSDIIAKDWMGNDLSDSIQVSVEPADWGELGSHTITYTVKDSCDRTATVTRTVFVTQCEIPIILTKQVYDPYENIGIMIDPSSHVLFNQNFMNNIVKYRLTENDPWTTAIILSGTPDRKLLYIKNPGVIASKIFLYVDVGSDNIGADGCYTTDEVNFAIVSKEEQDKPLDVDGKASIVKKKNSVSRFDDLNFEPIYNKDLSYSSFTITADENSLMQNVYSILLTNLGERLYDDEFGSTLEESVFEIIGDLNGESKLLNECVTLINKYEPRVVVVEDKSYVAINEDNTVVIILYIKVPRGIARKIELTFRKDS